MGNGMSNDKALDTFQNTYFSLEDQIKAVRDDDTRLALSSRLVELREAAGGFVELMKATVQALAEQRQLAIAERDAAVSAHNELDSAVQNNDWKNEKVKKLASDIHSTLEPDLFDAASELVEINMAESIADKFPITYEAATHLIEYLCEFDAWYDHDDEATSYIVALSELIERYHRSEG